MEYFIALMALLAGFHAYSYARWLKQNGARLGWASVTLLAAAATGIAFYRLLMQ